MTGNPFFSVVIPTRNRASLLRYALQTALEQDFDDYEIVVSDNCSQDDTAQVVKDYQTARVRYVRVDHPLSMPDHWEFALDQARGRFVTYLSDDDALTRAACSRAAAAIERHESKLVVMQSAEYYSGDWFDKTLRNILVIIPHTGKELQCNSGDTLKKVFACGILRRAPRMLNSFCDLETMRRFRAQFKRIFLLCPDYSFAASILTEMPSWIFIDEPLHIQGVTPLGIGSTGLHNRGEPVQEFIAEFNDTKLLKRVPLDLPIVTSNIAETLLMCKETLASRLSNYEIDWNQYFISSWEDIVRHESNGVAVDADKAEFHRVLAGQPQEVQDTVRFAVNPRSVTTVEPIPPLPNPIRRAARKVVNSSSVLMNLESLVRKPRPVETAIVESPPTIGPEIVNGEDAGFSNILECARWLPNRARCRFSRGV
jgi:hypothetical protein